MDNSEGIHRHSLRLKDFDYSQAGAYFVTICTKNRQCIFGTIQQGKMQLNASGRVASAQWQQLPYRFTDLELGEWVVMPNHIHGILVITGRGEAYMGRGEASLKKIEFVDMDPFLPDASPLQLESISKDVSPLRPTGTTSGSVGAMIQNYKSITSRKISAQIEKMRGSVWQRNYYEHVIRNECELNAISIYILTNPQNWEKDTEYIM